MAVYELTLCFYALLLIKASSPPLCSRHSCYRYVVLPRSSVAGCRQYVLCSDEWVGFESWVSIITIQNNSKRTLRHGSGRYAVYQKRDV